MPSKGVSQDKPRYPIPWIATYFITGLVLIAGSFVIVWYVNQFSSQYDYTDPDMIFLEAIILSPDPRRGDFTKLNGGNWRSLCLIGWQGDLAEAIVVAKLPPASAQALLGAYDALAGDTDSGEFIFLYADKSGEAKALKHPHGFAFAHEGQAACTTPARPVLVIPVRVKLAL